MIAVVIHLALALVASTSIAQTGTIPPPAERALLKDWALARCLAAAGKGQVLGDDASKSAAALLERGQSGIAVHERIDALAKATLSRPSAGSVPSDYNVLKCIQFYHGKALDRLVSTARRP